MQQGILFHTLYTPEPGVYSVQWTCTLRGVLHITAFKHAWQRVLDRHSILRTAFIWELRDEPFQVVYRQVELPWRQHDWRSMSAAERERQIEAFLVEDRRQGFELSKAPSMRLSLIQLAKDAYQCVWSLHHILLDGWSRPLLLREVFQTYDAFSMGREPHLDVCRPYGDYITWLQGQDLSPAEMFWRRTLRGFTMPTALNVTQDHGGASSPAEDYAEQWMHLSTEATAALQTLARRHRLSFNTLVQGAWATLLGRYSGQEDVVFGATISGRPPDLAGVESMIGLFINSLAVRVRIDPEVRLVPWLQALQNQQVEARQYEYSPLVQVQGWSDVPRGLPLFESLMVFENYPARAALEDWSDTLEIQGMRVLSTTHYPLTVVAVPGLELRIKIGYQSRRFDTATITRMLGHLRTLLEGMAADPEQRLTDLPMLTAAERHQLLVEWNDTVAAYSDDICMHQWFEAQVVRTPDAVAVAFEEKILTYRELNIRANQLAHYLRALGVGPDVPVGIYVERSLEMIVGLLGILKAGGAYVPVDPSYPRERLAFTLRDAQVAVLLTQQRLTPGLAGHQALVVCLDADWDPVAGGSRTNPVNKTTPGNLAYVIYTSGSTGVPKGVSVEHRQLCTYLHGILKRLPLPNNASFASVSTLAADLGLTMIFGALCTGGCLHILAQERVTDPDAMAEYFRCHAIDCLKIVPSHLEALHTSTRPKDIFPRRLLILGGEASRSGWVKRLQRLASNCVILNHYGPTEATVGVLTYRVDDSVYAPETSTLPLGCPLANVQAYILGEYLHPVPVGIQGELYVGGATLARGYLNRPALTAERFIPDPFNRIPGARLYKTGDLARYLPGGAVEFLGRFDHQVKVRGYRVELGEVEATLEQHPAVRQAIVLLREDTSGDKRLSAYCVPRQGSVPDPRELRHFLQTKLPDYMVPGAFIVLDGMPLTPNGKIDRQALPAPDQTQSPLIEAFVAACTPVEELLSGIWESVLKVESIGIHDNFFALGGHSLLAMQAISRIRKVLQVDVPLRALFEAPTVAALTQHIAEIRGQTQSQAAPPLKAMPRGGAVPLTMIQEHLWALDRLLPGAPFSNMPYVARLTGSLNVAALERSLNEVIKRHDILRTTFTTIEGRPVQVSSPTLHIPLAVEDLRALSETERQAEEQRAIFIAGLYPFDLEEGPLIEVRILRFGEQEHLLLLTMHHIISDGWSWGVLWREVGALYEAFCRGRPSPLPNLPLQYADYAHWQRHWLDSETGKSHLEYWMQQLRHPLPMLKLPTDRPPPAELSLQTARQSFLFPPELTVALRRLSHQEHTTLFMTLLAAFKMLLYGYSGQEDIRVGTLVANRQHQDTEGLIGLFANLVVLRTHLGGDPSLREVLRRVRTTTLDAYAHQELPFEHLARVWVGTHQSDRQSLFQAMFALQNARQHTLELPNLRIEVLETEPLEASACDLAVSVCESPQGLEGLWIYKTELFDAATIMQMIKDCQQIIEHILAQPELPLSAVHTQRAR